jgi:hypothetical protein
VPIKATFRANPSPPLTLKVEDARYRAGIYRKTGAQEDGWRYVSFGGGRVLVAVNPFGDLGVISSEPPKDTVVELAPEDSATFTFTKE